jgi:hypothetical protein
MKKIAIGISTLCLTCLFAFQNNECATTATPPLNKKIIAFVKSKIGKPVTTYSFSYCFDLVEYAYKSAGIEYHNYSVGTKTEYKTECVFPGDVIGFGSDVKYTYIRNDTTWTQSFNTFEMLYVIYKVKGKGDYVLAHEEGNGKKRKVMLMDFKMSQVIKGKPKIYRPTK